MRLPKGCIIMRTIGKEPLARDDNGNLLSRIGTLFVGDRVLVTLPRMTHAMQRLHYLGLVNQERKAQGLPLADEEDVADAVDLIMEGASVLIRPEPSRMALAFEADELLQTIESKRNIRFLHARDARVQEAIRTRGEYWRISPHPKKDEEVISAIGQSRIAIGGLPIYYYNSVTGTRYLTLQAFRGLGNLKPEPLRQHLTEIQEYTAKRNRHHNEEVALFGLKPDGAFNADAFKAHDFAAANPEQLREQYRVLCAAFEDATEEKLQSDNVKDEFWRNHMFACLTDKRTLSETLVSGLTEEFFRQIEWLPGGRIENKDLIFDPIFNEPDAKEAGLCDTYVKGFIFNYVREFGELEYVNIGRLLPGLRSRQAPGAHRAYIAEVKHRDAQKPILRILRVQKYGIKEHLVEHPDNLLRAIMETQDYTEYTLDRRLGCWELDMPLPPRLDMRIIPDDYRWQQGENSISRIWVTYYERDFIDGLATDKISKAQLGNAAFALRLAELLGQAAAPNMVVGRMLSDINEVIFDQGDEMLLLDESGIPYKILVADHAGTFADYTSALETFAEAYAQPVLSRLERIPQQDRAAFADAYLSAMETRLIQMQEKYERYRQGFDVLFQHSKQGKESFSDRWAKVLHRLRFANMKAIVQKIREIIRDEGAGSKE